MIRFSQFIKLGLLLTLMSCVHSAPRKVELSVPTPELYRAAGTGNLEALAQASDLQVKGANELGTTLLMVAARRNRLNSVDYLLSRGAAANAIDIHKQTVLHYALPVKNALLNSRLLSAGADASVEDQFGVVPAITWAEEGSLDSLLLAVQNKDKWCCYGETRVEIQNVLREASKKKKYVPPALFLILKELE
jgi:ankyrin repeat protein